MKKMYLLFGVLSMGFAIVVSCNDPRAQEPVADGSLSTDSLVKRGEYLVTVIGCGDCHSPKVMGPQGPMPAPGLELSGHPSSMPLPKVDTSASEILGIVQPQQYRRGWALGRFLCCQYHREIQRVSAPGRKSSSSAR